MTSRPTRVPVDLRALLLVRLSLLFCSDSNAVAAPDVAGVSTAQQPCSVKTSVVRHFEAQAAAAGVRHLAGLDTCVRADGNGALVTVHFQLAHSAELLAELHEHFPPQNDPAGALGAPGACADLVAQHGCAGDSLPPAILERIRGNTLGELCPASCLSPKDDATTKAVTAAELIRSALIQPALGCSRSTPACPRAVLVSLPTGGPVNSYILRMYAARSAHDGAELPLVVELSLAVLPVPWGTRDHGEASDTVAAGAAAPHHFLQLPRRSTLLPTPYSAFAAHRAVLTSPLRRHLRIGARYNFEVITATDIQAVALVPAQAEQGAVQSRWRPRWIHLAPAEGIAPKPGIVRWRGSAAIKALGGLMLMAQSSSDNYDALVLFETTDDARLVNGSTGVTGDRAWRTPVRIIPSESIGDLGLQPLSHRYSEIFLADPHMTMTLATKRAVRLRVQTANGEQQVLHVEAGKDEVDHDTCTDGESETGAVWEQPRVLVTHNDAHTEHTIYVHWDHADEAFSSASDGNRLLQIYAADTATADNSSALNQGWPQVLEYSVWISSSKHGTVPTTMHDLAASLGGWLTGSTVGSGPPSFVPLKQTRSGDSLSVHLHLQNLPSSAADSLEGLVSQNVERDDLKALIVQMSRRHQKPEKTSTENLLCLQATELCIWDEPSWNYRSIFGWVTKNIE